MYLIKVDLSKVDLIYIDPIHADLIYVDVAHSNSFFFSRIQVTVKPGLYESLGTAENIRITRTFVQLRLSMYRRGFRRDRAKNSYNPRFRTT